MRTQELLQAPLWPTEQPLASLVALLRSAAEHPSTPGSGVAAAWASGTSGMGTHPGRGCSRPRGRVGHPARRTHPPRWSATSSTQDSRTGPPSRMPASGGSGPGGKQPGRQQQRRGWYGEVVRAEVDEGHDRSGGDKPRGPPSLRTGRSRFRQDGSCTAPARAQCHWMGLWCLGHLTTVT